MGRKGRWQKPAGGRWWFCKFIQGLKEQNGKDTEMWQSKVPMENPNGFVKLLYITHLRFACKCVLPAVCPEWVHWCWSAAWVEPEGAIQAVHVSGSFVVMAFQTLFWESFFFLLVLLGASPHWFIGILVSLITFAFLKKCYLICEVEVLKIFMPHGYSSTSYGVYKVEIMEKVCGQEVCEVTGERTPYHYFFLMVLRGEDSSKQFWFPAIIDC